MGLAKARESAGRLSSAPPPDAVAVAGVGGSLIDKLQPGDLVVAELVIDTSGREVAWLASAPSLAADLRHLGLRARSGTIVSTDHIVTGGERAMLAALGADVVDMESSAVADASWHAPLAVVRAISDTPGQELFSPAGVAGALTALRALRASRRALANWAATAGPPTPTQTQTQIKRERFFWLRRARRARRPRTSSLISHFPWRSAEMGIPLRQSIKVGAYVAKQKLAHRDKFPLIVELEPLFACNLECNGCGKIQYPTDILRKRLTVDQAVAAMEECGAPMVSIAGGEPLLHPDIDKMTEALLDNKRFVYLCTNALLLERKLDRFKPHPGVLMGHPHRRPERAP